MKDNPAQNCPVCNYPHGADWKDDYKTCPMCVLTKSTPTPHADQIKRSRHISGLSEQQAAALIYQPAEDWQAWESGSKTMDPAFYELFKIKAGLLKLL